MISSQFIIILENVERLQIYDVFSLGQGKSYIQKSVIFPSRSSYAINIYIHSSIYIYAIYLYKIRLLFIFIVTFLDSIKTALGSR